MTGMFSTLLENPRNLMMSGQQKKRGQLRESVGTLTFLEFWIVATKLVEIRGFFLCDSR
jgi:hypothetical protein